ncbi:hypothetical protein OF83DRAFT_1083580 [Amylostereum chailletii]|nr:hypothetical protein OF83DRAFT_1083580 [Amylostereum chailletii]
MSSQHPCLTGTIFKNRPRSSPPPTSFSVNVRGNNRFVLHDSQGFECGEEGNLQTVLNFIDEQAKMTALQDQLHAIWLCIEIPFANGRTFETGDERLLREVEGKVPIFVVFTKLDILRMRIQQALDESEEAESMSDEEFDKAVSSAVNDKHVLPASVSHWHHFQEPTALVPTANELLRQCPRLRILVLGKTVQFDSSGVHDITTPLTSKGNNRFVLHDSQGFECGEEGNLQTVLNFIDEQAKMTALQDQLHAIWLCIEIPFANGRTFETGDERLLREVEGKVPIFVVFTKLDILRMRIQQALDESEEAESMSDEEFDKAVSSAVNDKVQELCIEPLYALQAVRPYQWAAVSIKTKQELYVKTIEGLISTVLEHLTEKVWLTWAMAQRANANANIKASIMCVFVFLS